MLLSFQKRPVGRGSCYTARRPAPVEHIWYASSDDLLHWALPDVLLPTNGGPWWDGLRVGTGAPPIRTEKGWLLIYHGVKEAGHGHPIYRLGVALLDPEGPRKGAGAVFRLGLCTGD